VILGLSPGCHAVVLPWGAEGVCLTVRAAGPSGVRTCSVVREGPWEASLWGWRRAGLREGPATASCPVVPYGPPAHLAESLRWLLSELSPCGCSRGSIVRAALLLREGGLREALDVMES
jgi:hypothetical protein